MTPFSFPETQAILKDAVVEVSMKSIVLSRAVKVEKLPPWKFGEREIPTEQYRLFRACVEAAVKSGHKLASGRERERLLLMLRMTETDTNIDAVAAEVGKACEDYAVVMQNGADGLHSYRERFPA